MSPSPGGCCRLPCSDGTATRPNNWNRLLLTIRRDPFTRIAAARRWVRAGDATRGFDAALAGAQEANQVLATLEEARMLVYALSLWSQVPDAAERAGFTRDDLVRLTVTALVDEAPRAEVVALIDREIGRTPDQIRDIFLRYARDGIKGLDELYPPPTQGAADICSRLRLTIHGWRQPRPT